MNHYDVLGIPRNAAPSEIRKAYRKLALLEHPDRNPGDKEAAGRFKKVQEAYDVLGDPVLRAGYDLKTPKTPTPQASNPWEDFFGSGRGDRGRNIQIRVGIELEDVLRGITKEVTLQARSRCVKCEGRGFSEWQPCPKCFGSGRTNTKQSPFNIYMSCPSCHGTGRAGVIKCIHCSGCGYSISGDRAVKVAILPGTDSGHQIRLPGEGEPGKNGGRSGDVFIIVVVKPHDLYKRIGRDIFLEVPVTYGELVLGTRAKIPLLGGGITEVNIPAATQPGSQFRVKDKGVPDFASSGKGDLIATVKLDLPTGLTDEYKAALETLFQLEKNNVSPQREKYQNHFKEQT